MTNRFSETSKDIQSRLAWSVMLAGAGGTAGYAGGPVFVGLCGAFLILAYMEWCAITRSPDGGLVFILALALSVYLAITSLFNAEPLYWLIAMAGGLAVLALLLSSIRWMLFGLVYFCLTFGAMFGLRLDPNGGLIAVLFVAFVVWGTDIFAYLVGRMLKGPKLAPRVSPGKTWAGAFGGICGGALCGLGALWATDFTLASYHIVLAASLSIAAQLGDLGESGLKRKFDVKHASLLIPGHGGMFDRIDGLLAAMFVAYIVGVLRGGPSGVAEGLLYW